MGWLNASVLTGESLKDLTILIPGRNGSITGMWFRPFGIIKEEFGSAFGGIEAKFLDWTNSATPVGLKLRNRRISVLTLC